MYRVRFEDTFPSYCTLLMKSPVAGLGALVEGADGRGLVFQMSLPPKEFEAMSSPAIREHVHRFRRAATTFRDCTARFTADASTGSQHLDCLQPPRMDHRIHRGGEDESNTAATPVCSGSCSTPHSILMP